ncbi:myogenesis-regulating glycosidase-like [Rhynchophorus ferrugineus]|uniref:myogenesis-regulating glycosidase-like n=1 Tax=Rhynchophorus ferrugineus TaxID=354439 RepID=UPI003FCED4DE
MNLYGVRFGILSFLFLLASGELLKDTTQSVHLEYDVDDEGLNILLKKDGKLKLSGKLGVGKSLKNAKCLGQKRCALSDNEELSIVPLKDGFNIKWSSKDTLPVYEDCFELKPDSTHWYGGPERYVQVWPLELMQIDSSEPYIIKKSDNFAIAERYWLNSNGTFIFLDDTVPLWVNQNSKLQGQVCFKAEAVSPYVNREQVELSYVIKVYDDAKEAHLKAINDYLGKPTGYPNEKMVAEPIWTTWAKYKQGINDNIVLQFANDIRSHGYQGGQLEIDDAWETCYGAQTFRTDNFGDISNTVKSLKDNNWRVTLWIHPFVDDTCQDNSNYGKEHGYFAQNTSGDISAVWWNSDNSHQVDFTKSEAADWWAARLKKLQQSPGIDSFKFDAGEINYMKMPPKFDDVYHSPNILTTKYVDTCAQFGDLIEVRSGFRTQRNPSFVRMIDKSSDWGISNGLASLITTLLQMNMNGYGMVLPDMIGGNGYGNKPTGELIVRWIQVNTFMPSMQFSYLPWDYTSSVSFDIEGISKKYVQLHEQYAPKIIEAMQRSVSDGSPVNPPVWWADPDNEQALGIADEYLLGDDILVAPVIQEGAVTRDVFIPKGQWKDGNSGQIYTGPVTILNYSAPIDVLPWFIKV